MNTNESVLSYEMNKVNVDEEWKKQSEEQKPIYAFYKHNGHLTSKHNGS